MIRVLHPGSGFRIRIFYPSRIPDPGVKKPPGPGSAALIKPAITRYKKLLIGLPEFLVHFYFIFSITKVQFLKSRNAIWDFHHEGLSTYVNQRENFALQTLFLKNNIQNP